MNCYDRQGLPMSVDAWSAKANVKYKRVALTTVRGYMISTVWLGLDHNFSGKGPPLIFETMVFKGRSHMDLFCARYATEEGARIGHNFVVYAIRRGMNPRNIPQPDGTEDKR